MTMPDTTVVNFRLIGPDTGIARLIADLELAGADYPIVAEPDTDEGGDPLDPRSYAGQLTGLTAAQAIEVVRACLATTSGQQVWINDQEIELLQ
jgi:hypothetical protein